MTPCCQTHFGVVAVNHVIHVGIIALSSLVQLYSGVVWCSQLGLLLCKNLSLRRTGANPKASYTASYPPTKESVLIKIRFTFHMLNKDYEIPGLTRYNQLFPFLYPCSPLSSRVLRLRPKLRKLPFRLCRFTTSW